MSFYPHTTSDRENQIEVSKAIITSYENSIAKYQQQLHTIPEDTTENITKRQQLENNILALRNQIRIISYQLSK